MPGVAVVVVVVIIDGNVLELVNLKIAHSHEGDRRTINVDVVFHQVRCQDLCHLVGCSFTSRI